MPVYTYTYRDASGGVQKGTAEAESEEVLRKRFEEQGFTLTEVTMIRARGTKPKRYGKVRLNNLSIFCRQFSTMVDAGVSLVRCLDVLSQQTQDPKLRKIIMDVGERVEGGESLSRAMQRHPRTFSNLFIGLIRAGEVGGVLEESLQRLSHFLEKDVELRRKVKSALTYPVLVLVMATGITFFLVYWFVPQFAKILEDLGLSKDKIPGPTQFLIDLAHNLEKNWWVFLLVIVGIIVAYKLFVSTRFGRRIADREPPGARGTGEALARRRPHARARRRAQILHAPLRVRCRGQAAERKVRRIAAALQKVGVGHEDRQFLAARQPRRIPPAVAHGFDHRPARRAAFVAAGEEQRDADQIVDADALAAEPRRHPRAAAARVDEPARMQRCFAAFDLQAPARCAVA
ncbi:MAG: type II secretion system F family protein, partial [Armatimonadetes bacterium]